MAKSTASDTATEGTDYVSPAVTITAKVAGFRRAGRAHAAEPTSWPAGSFTAAELTALEDEPMLLVREDAAAATA